MYSSRKNKEKTKMEIRFSLKGDAWMYIKIEKFLKKYWEFSKLSKELLFKSLAAYME